MRDLLIVAAWAFPLGWLMGLELDEHDSQIRQRSAAPLVVASSTIEGAGLAGLESRSRRPGGARIEAPTDRHRYAPSERAVPDPLTELARRVEIPEAWYDDATTRIEDPHGAMTPFYESLLRTAGHQEGAVTRIGHWSDSSLSSDGPSGSMRRRLQKAFGDAGHGWLVADPGVRWYHHRDVRHDYGGWRPVNLVGNRARDLRYGLGGVVSYGRNGAWLKVGTVPGRPVGGSVGLFRIHYMKGPRYGVIDLLVDGHRVGRLDTDAPEVAEAVHTVEVPDGHHRLELEVRGGRRARVFGVALERRGPGVVYDSFGVLGLKVSKLLTVDEDHWRRQLAFRDHDLMIVQLGGNSLQDPHLNPGRYERRFARLLQRFRSARPAAACLVAGTHDHGVRGYRGRITTDPRLLALHEVQRRAALGVGCAWYSLVDAMGGENSVAEWRERELISGDLRHLTNKGASVLARRFFASLMADFAVFVKRRAGDPRDEEPERLAHR